MQANVSPAPTGGGGASGGNATTVVLVFGGTFDGNLQTQHDWLKQLESRAEQLCESPVRSSSVFRWSSVVLGLSSGTDEDVCV